MEDILSLLTKWPAQFIGSGTVVAILLRFVHYMLQRQERELVENNPYEDVPYFQDRRWKPLIDLGIKVPYSSPTDEYLRNTFTPSERDLLYRWQGMGLEPEIFEIFADCTMPVERHKVQQIKKRLAGVPDYSDPEDLRIDNFYNLKRIAAMIEDNEKILGRGFEEIVESEGTIFDGFTKKVVKRPLTTKSRCMIQSQQIELMKAENLLNGKATEILHVQSGQTVNHTQNTIVVLNDPEKAKSVHELTEQLFGMKRLPRGEVLDSPEIKEAELVEVSGE
jgi:hypothetical protein